MTAKILHQIDTAPFSFLGLSDPVIREPVVAKFDGNGVSDQKRLFYAGGPRGENLAKPWRHRWFDPKP